MYNSVQYEWSSREHGHREKRFAENEHSNVYYTYRDGLSRYIAIRRNEPILVGDCTEFIAEMIVLGVVDAY